RLRKQARAMSVDIVNMYRQVSLEYEKKLHRQSITLAAVDDLLGLVTNSRHPRAMEREDAIKSTAATLTRQDERYVKLIAKREGILNTIGELEFRVPAAPFANTWHELALKHALVDAVGRGLDALAWTPGIVQVERWESALRENLERVDWEVVGDGQYRVVGYPIDQNVPPIEQIVSPEGVAGLIGKENADTIIGDKSGKGSIEGSNLKIAKPFMFNLYDKKAVQFMNKLGKKHGVKVEKEVDEDGNEWWVFRIPESLKAVVKGEGLPLFQDDEGPKEPRKVRGVYLPDERVIELTEKADFSTLMHEMGHWYMHALNELSQVEGADATVRGDLETIF
ncbi:hypothetical protein LCGC14_3150810, partial [marine sediment metagenome]